VVFVERFKVLTRVLLAVLRPSLIGLTGSYFSNPLLEGIPARTQVDKAIAFEWQQVIVQHARLSGTYFSYITVAFEYI
jgi:hypothetical protein